MKHIEVIARGVCVKGGKVLLCHRKGASNTYLPGGHVEFNEQAARSLCREIREEMGLRSTAGRFLGGVEHTFKQNGRRHCEINLVFELKISGITPAKKPKSREDYIEFVWVPIGRLAKAHLEPAVLCRFLSGWLGRSGKTKTGAWVSSTGFTGQ